MLLDFFISIILLPNLWSKQFNFDGFLNLHQTPQAITLDLEAQAPKRIYTDVLDVKVTAKRGIAIDLESGKILYKKNSQEQSPLASITKLMTALVFVDNNPGWQNEISILPIDQRNGGTVYLNIGEIINLKDLFATTLIVSDNEAAAALARSTGLSEEEFVKRMNAKAQELGLVNTHFVDPTGLNDANVSTAEETAKLLNFALQNQDISQTTSQADYSFAVKGKNKTRAVKIKNTDLLLKSYLNVLGGKTGSLQEAGYCLAVKIKGEQKQEIIVVVLDSQTNLDRFQDVKAITDWIFTNYQWPSKK